MFLDEAFQFMIAEKCCIQKLNPFVTMWLSLLMLLCQLSKISSCTLWDDVTMLGVAHIREKGPLLAHLHVLKTSQLWRYFLYYMKKIISGW